MPAGIRTLVRATFLASMQRVALVMQETTGFSFVPRMFGRRFPPTRNADILRGSLAVHEVFGVYPRMVSALRIAGLATSAGRECGALRSCC